MSINGKLNNKSKLMKQIYSFILLLGFWISYGQINDTDAKIMYQQAEDLYNQNSFYDASQTALTLKERCSTYILKAHINHI